MLLIGDVIVSEDILEEDFLCKLDACKGACCWEGDYGAPLEKEEMELLEHILDRIKPFLPDDSHVLLENEGPFKYYREKKMYGTTLHKNGACVFLRFDQNGIAKCGIEEAYNAGEVEFQKPVSCHLYPVRATTNQGTGFEALNYDRWEICSAACAHGKANAMPLYRFVREALVRKYGLEFYTELDEVAQSWRHKEADEGR